MASVDFMKLKSVYDVRAVVKHCDIFERQKNDHANKNIDKTKTKTNGQITGRDYKATMSRYSNRIKELDKTTNTNKRKDRVTAFSLCVPIPDGVSNHHDFVMGVWACISKQYGRDNVVNFYVHNDEVHDYKDAKTGEDRTSLSHVHFIVVSEVNGQLNGKKFSSKANMTRLNKAIDEFSCREFGIPFLSGKKTKSKEEVETLKLQSERRELEAEKDDFIRYKASERSKLDKEREQIEKERKQVEEQKRVNEALQKRLQDMLIKWEQNILPYLKKVQDKLSEKQKDSITKIEKRVEQTRDLIPDTVSEPEEPNEDTGYQYH